jgi:hypothetical protein
LWQGGRAKGVIAKRLAGGPAGYVALWWRGGVDVPACKRRQATRNAFGQEKLLFLLMAVPGANLSESYSPMSMAGWLCGGHE